MLRILFVHNNFPGQYAQLASTLAARGDVELRAIATTRAKGVPGVQMVRYPAPDGVDVAVHPFARRFQSDALHAEQVLYVAQSLIATGFVPDVVFAHPGWGEALPLRLLFPQARIVCYCEFYYRASGADVGFDDAYPRLTIDGLIRVELRNAAQLLALTRADIGVAPTRWQKSLYPDALQDRIAVIHDGIDTEAIAPDPQAIFAPPGGSRLTRRDKVLTFVARALEPMRGFHVFMRALPAVLARHPDLHVVIVGADRVSYGAHASADASWRTKYLAELGSAIDLRRVAFHPRLARDDLTNLFQITRAHFYFTYPFVLSWSLLEAMACGAVVVGSATPPVQEVIRDGQNGVLTPFFDVAACAERICDVLEAPERFVALTRHARATVVERFDFARVSLPAYLDLIEGRLPSIGRTLPPATGHT